VAQAAVIALPVRRDERAAPDDLSFALATAGDLQSAVSCVADWLGSRVEWWWLGDDGAPELVAAAGPPRARRQTVPLGPAGDLVLHGERLDRAVKSQLLSLTPILRRRAAEERLTRRAMQLARRNEALEDFAALVAHELKTPLHAALMADDPSGPLEEALELVDAVLQAAQLQPSHRTFASAAEALAHAIEDLRVDVEISSDFATAVPMPEEALRVVVRNLLRNAVAAGARTIRVTTERSSTSYRLVVEDDGAGLADGERYATGHGLGLALCRRIARRFDGLIQLVPNPSGGARATLEFMDARR
jgi:two-component system, OmpR family, osmolarity sensor histidine kinase EnvZ